MSSPSCHWQWPHLALVLHLALIPAALAQVCYQGTYNAEITRQEDLDAIAQTCTTLTGRLNIRSNYTGSFVLPNVTDIQGGVDQYPGLPLYNTEITSMEFPDLVRADYIELNTLLNLSRLGLPKLESVDVLRLEYFTGLERVNVPELRNASRIEVMGNYSGISFEKLESVSNKLTICNTVDCQEVTNREASMEISLPALKSVKTLEVVGNVSSLSLPELETVGYQGDDYINSKSDLKLALLGDAVVVDFPKLTGVGGDITVKGNITSLSLPSLRTHSKQFSVYTDEALNVSLPVEGLNKIKLEGKIQSAQFPNLVDFKETRIESDLNFDCGAFIDALKETATNVTVERDVNVFCIGGSAPDGTDGAAGFSSSAGIVAVVAAMAGLALYL
ncbi:uncharacterized protein BDV17DRAFT_249300 [Aspergillus undulatus]|uniref:uncharacterized protein n=1 Tax=Aspergillus undulatus TaxID=1810928 RepID=UPI003CCD057A